MLGAFARDLRLAPRCYAACGRVRRCRAGGFASAASATLCVVAKRGDDFGLLLASGILLGVGLLAASEGQGRAEHRRQRFEDAVRNALVAGGVSLVGAALGRGRDNAPFWELTLESVEGVWTQRVDLDRGMEPFAPAAVDRIREAVLTPSEVASGGGGV